jgi:hypothetical protein
VSFSIPNGIIEGKLQWFSVSGQLSKFQEKSGLNPENTRVGSPGCLFSLKILDPDMHTPLPGMIPLVTQCHKQQDHYVSMDCYLLGNSYTNRLSNLFAPRWTRWTIWKEKKMPLYDYRLADICDPLW